MADVLIVDDDLDVRVLLDVMLARLGHQVRAVGSAEDALLASAQRRADLMLLDLSLPGLDGDEFLTWLDRGIGRPRSLCIVSAHPPERVRPLAGRYGATYLAKPFHPRQLERAVTTSLASIDGEVTLLP